MMLLEDERKKEILIYFEKLPRLRTRDSAFSAMSYEREGKKKIARYVQPFLERFERQCPRVMFRGTRKEAYPEDAYPEMQRVSGT